MKEARYAVVTPRPRFRRRQEIANPTVVSRLGFVLHVRGEDCHGLGVIPPRAASRDGVVVHTLGQSLVGLDGEDGCSESGLAVVELRLANLALDADPEIMRPLRQNLAIDDAYFTAIAPDPSPSELEKARQRLRRVLGPDQVTVSDPEADVIRFRAGRLRSPCKTCVASSAAFTSSASISSGLVTPVGPERATCV